MEQYIATVNAFGKAVSAVGGPNVCQLTQQQKESCHLALQALMDHEREHGCVKRRKRRVRPNPSEAGAISVSTHGRALPTDFPGFLVIA
jgi:hypothetical protein